MRVDRGEGEDAAHLAFVGHAAVGGDSRANWPRRMRDLKPNQALTPAERAEMRPEMEPASPSSRRRLASSSATAGRYPITYSKDYISTLLPNIQDTRMVAYVLQYDAMFRTVGRPQRRGRRDLPRPGQQRQVPVGDEPTLVASW